MLEPFDYNYKPSLEELLNDAITLQQLPQKIAELLGKAPADAALKTYREGAWTVMQQIHHLADACMHNFLRTKWTLCEDSPRVKIWDENVWASELDYTFSIESSYGILLGLMQRWSLLILEILKRPELLKKGFEHPDRDELVTLDVFIHLNAWHVNRHLEYIKLSLDK